MMQCSNFEQLGFGVIDLLITNFAQEDIRVDYVFGKVCEELSKHNILLDDTLASQIKTRIMRYGLFGVTDLKGY